MELSECIGLFIRLFQVFGMAPYSQVPATLEWKPNRLNKIICILYLIGYVVGISLVVLFHTIVFKSYEDSLAFGCMVYMMIMVYLNVFAILIETIYKCPQRIKLLNLFRKIELYSKCYQDVQVDYADIRCTMYRLIAFWTIQTILLTGSTTNMANLCFVLAYTLPRFVSKINYFHWIVFVKTLYANLDALGKYTKTLGGNNINRTKATTIDFLSKCYYLSWKATNLINYTYYWSFVVGILIEFSILACNLFIVIVVVNRNFPWIRTLHALVCAAINIINILLITSASQKAVDAVIS